MGGGGGGGGGGRKKKGGGGVGGEVCKSIWIIIRMFKITIINGETHCKYFCIVH